MNSFVTMITADERAELAHKGGVGEQTVNDWLSKFAQQASSKDHYVKAVDDVMKVRNNSSRAVLLFTFLRFNQLKKYKRAVHEKQAELAKQSREEVFQRKMGFSRKTQLVFQRMMSDYGLEKVKVSAVNAQLSNQISKLQTQIEAHESALERKWRLVTELKRVSNAALERNEESWFDSWMEMDDEARADYEDFAAYRAMCSSDALVDRQREFMNRGETVVTIACYVAKLNSNERADIAKAIEEEITSRDLTFLRRTILGEELQGVAQVVGRAGEGQGKLGGKLYLLVPPSFESAHLRTPFF